MVWLEKESKNEDINKITVQLELGIQVDDGDEYMMLLDSIPDYHGSWVRVYYILYCNIGVVRKRNKECENIN